MPFKHDLEDGQASMLQEDDASQATGDLFLDSVNAGHMPVYHG